VLLDEADVPPPDRVRLVAKRLEQRGQQRAVRGAVVGVTMSRPTSQKPATHG
jgi:hypothetical protein